jgi:membrane protein DedA with SNARE-associated domain
MTGFGQFTDLVANASGWAYLILLLFAYLDALVPIVPSEASVITAGVVASSGDLSLPVVMVIAATGAFLGDNTGYLLGRRFGGRITERFFSGEKATRRVKWAERQIRERGGQLILIGRFIPGGRTLVALTAGTAAYPWRRFALLDATAASGWALYAALLGYFGGRAFEEKPWKGLLLAFGLALSVTALTELIRMARRRRCVTTG